MRHYLDHNATTPADPRVLEHFLAIERECPANPHSLHGSGREARATVETARERIAAAIGRPRDDVLLVSGGTEANNLAVAGLGDPLLPVLLGGVEHPSVREPAARRGVVSLDVGATGRVRIVRPAAPVGLVCLVHGQSEVGTLQPIGDAARLATELRVPLFVDAAQTLGRVPLAPIFETADAVSLSPHKAGGLRGMGVLVVCSSLGVRPLLLGGGQERGLRPGTMSPALAAATSLAIELAIAEQAERAARMAAARVAFLAGLAEASVDLMRIGDESSCLPNTLMLQFAHLDGRHLLPALDLEGVEASQGSACSSGSPTPPHVLSAMGLDEASARACVRFSFGARHDEAAAFVAGTIAGRVVARLQKKKPVVR